MYKFFAYLNRMKYIKRWGLMYCSVDENIMEHSQHVAVVAHALATISNTYFGGSLNADHIAVKALFHETSEVLTGDLPTPIKYFNPEIKNAYKGLEKISNDKLLGYLPTEVAPIYDEIVNDESSIEHKFVKYADKICAYVKCVEEVKMGNREFVKAEKSLKAELEALSVPEVDYFMTHFIPAYALTLDEME